MNATSPSGGQHRRAIPDLSVSAAVRSAGLIVLHTTPTSNGSGRSAAPNRSGALRGQPLIWPSPRSRVLVGHTAISPDHQLEPGRRIELLTYALRVRNRAGNGDILPEGIGCFRRSEG
jgi:hypothetical protein